MQRAFVTNLSPLRVRLSQTTTSVDVRVSMVKANELSVGDPVYVEVDRYQIVLLGRVDGITGGGHDDDNVDDTITVENLTASGRLRSITVAWDRVEQVHNGHGYYEVHIATSIGYNPLTSRTETKNLSHTFTGLSVGVNYFIRVRPVGSDGVPGEWAEVGPIQAPGVLGEDIANGAVDSPALAERAVDLLHLADESLGDERLFVPGLIKGHMLAANTITTRQLIVGSFDNLVQNHQFNSIEPHEPRISGGGEWLLNTDPNYVLGGPASLRYHATNQTQVGWFTLNGPYNDPDSHVPAHEGERFSARIYARTVTGTRDVRLRLEYRDADTNLISSEDSPILSASTAWQSVAVHSNPLPAGTAYVTCSIRVLVSGTGNNVYFDGAHMRQRYSAGEVIIDGTLSVTDAEILAVNVSKLTGGSLTVGQFIRSPNWSVANETGWQINANGDFTTYQGTIKGVEIIGTRIRTAATGPRVEINGISSTQRERISFPSGTADTPGGKPEAAFARIDTNWLMNANGNNYGQLRLIGPRYQSPGPAPLIAISSRTETGSGYNEIAVFGDRVTIRSQISGSEGLFDLFPRWEGDTSHGLMRYRLGSSNGVAIKYLGLSIQEVQIRNYADSAYRGIAASYFDVSSLAKGKRNILPANAEEVIEDLSRIKVREYELDDQPGQRHLGPVIDDTEESMPERFVINGERYSVTDVLGALILAVQNLYEGEDDGPNN